MRDEAGLRADLAALAIRFESQEHRAVFTRCATPPPSGWPGADILSAQHWGHVPLVAAISVQ